jgi:subtilisin family serine protease
MKSRLILAALGLVLCAASAVWAGALSPGLADYISNLGESDQVKVLVVLSDQADVKALDRELHDRAAPLAERHGQVVTALQRAAARTQAPLLADLDRFRTKGEVSGWTSHWLVNAVVLKGTVGAIKQLAQREDVERIELDLVVSPIEPVSGEVKTRDPGAKGIGMTDGIRAIQADRVWRELGVTGAGAIVGNLDTGVDGSHPALSARWRGHFAPTAECWLDVADLGDSTPVDQHYHCTHVMGTITGLAPDDTIGVAPGALWVASNAINQSTGSEFDNDIIASLEWFADPDGNPGTSDEVPDVVQNSWGVNEDFTGYYDCDSRWWDAIDNCEAAGCVLTWSAGNEGSGSGTIRSPADRAASPTNAFSVGSTIRVAPYTISDFSSRGPSGCGGPYAVKPEVCAPGEDIYSAEPGGGYQYLSGTSMAGPHVAGVVALMRSANPSVDVTTIKEILMATATDLGTAGEDNTYGHGLVNAYDAVLAVLDGIGGVEGIVTNSKTALPIAGSTVSDVGGYNTQSTDGNGYYRMILSAEDHTLEYRAFGYDTATQIVTVVEDDTVTANMVLDPSPTDLLGGFVFGPTGELVVGAVVEVLGTPVVPVSTDGDGYYEVVLPVGDTYSVRASAAGLGADQQTVMFDGAMQVNFHLPERFVDDFESGGFLIYPWQMSGTVGWTIDTAAPYEGTYCAKSGNIGDSQESVMSLQVQVLADGEISFYHHVSSESSYDFLRFFIDGSEKANWSGTTAWALATYPVTVGLRTFTWKYTKDSSVSSGSDCAWVDLIEFPSIAPPPLPSLVLTFDQLEYSLVPDIIRTLTKPLGNDGEADLNYRVTFAEAGAKAAQLALPPPLDLRKGEKDPRSGVAPAKGQGGPDLFGYSWIDSDDPGGPTYKWLEINTLGTVVGGGDDSMYGPFNLGFTFSFYGTDYTGVRICTNGFMTFTSTATDYSNDPIPNGVDPNAMIAPFWDDLNPNYGGTIYYYQDVANQQFIVEWDAVDHYSPSGNYETFQAILKADGSMVFQYRTVSLGTSCTVGVESPDGSDGLQVVYDAAYLHNDLAIVIASVPPISWVSATPDQGTIGPGEQADLPVTFDATGLALGVYLAEMTITTNDPDHSAVVIPLTLNVLEDMTDVAESGTPSAFSFHGASPNPFNPMTEIRFDLPVRAAVELVIYNVAGHRVRTLLAQEMRAGSHAVRWDGRDGHGRAVASGAYLVRLNTLGRQYGCSLVLVR